MKSKQLNYLLGIAVLVVWGLIFHRFFLAFFADNDDEPGTRRPVKKEVYNDFELKKDTAHLLLNYRDPFRIAAVKDTTKSKPMIKPAVITARKPATDWSQIKYSGFIFNPGTRKTVSIMIINGINLMLTEGESSQGIQLLKNLRDSVKISYRHQIKYITRNTTGT